MEVETEAGTTIRRRLTRRSTFRIAGTFAAVALLGCAAPAPIVVRPTPTSSSTAIPATKTPASPTSEPTATDTAPTPVPSATAVPTPIPRTATWWTGPADSTWLGASNEALRQLTLASPEFTVKVSGGHADFGRIIAGLASGQSPDVVDIGMVGPFASRGVLRSIDDLVGQGTTSASNYATPMWLNGSWTGKMYGIPALDHGPELGLVWNSSLAGGELMVGSPPTRWDELCRAGRSLTQPATTGTIERLGFDPLDGVGSLLDTVRDLTGEEWYDSTSKRVTLANTGYQTFLEGVLAYYASVGAERVAQFRQDVSPLTDSMDSGFIQGRQVALLTGYWTIGAMAQPEHDHNWKFASTWSPTLDGKQSIQRLGGRLAAIPVAAKNPPTSWDLVTFLAGDVTNGIFLDRTGRFSASRSFVNGATWENHPNLTFFLESITSATILSARGNNAVAGFAQVKWDQAIDDVISGRRGTSDALSVAQSGIEAEVRRLGA
ncbi:MAG TPA: extracellular solute-binding protein [Chloroflexota bacterium]|nr:extracellular solute-binding protein [Chloroflexota bacterium]